MFGGLFKKKQSEPPYTQVIEKWWQVFNVSDETRAKQDVYCLPCNLESPNNPNSARMNFTVPYGKPILISVVNAISYKKHSEVDKEKMINDVISSMDAITDKFVRVDEVDVTKHATRVRSNLFDLDCNNVAVTDGYWLYLKPLWRGQHVIERGACSPNSEASTYYNINIV